MVTAAVFYRLQNRRIILGTNYHRRLKLFQHRSHSFGYMNIFRIIPPRNFQGPGIQKMTVAHFAFIYFPGTVILVPAGIKDVNFVVPDIFLKVVKEVYTVW